MPDSERVLTGRDLREWRGERNQAEAAKLLSVSQKTVSKYESEEFADRPLPDKMQAMLNGRYVPPGFVSPRYSWTSQIFRDLQSRAPKRAEEVFVNAVISPSEGESGFADYASELRFTGLVLPQGESLLLDHVRDPGDGRVSPVPGAGTQNGSPVNLVLGGSPLLPNSLHQMDGEDHEVVIRQGDGGLCLKRVDAGSAGRDEKAGVPIVFGAPRARLREQDIGRLVPQYLSYEITGADERDPVSVFVRSNQGYNPRTADSVGFAYYTEADFCVERLRIEVEFRGGLAPPFPVPRAQLIRRTQVRQESLQATFLDAKEVRDVEQNIVRFTFGPLLRPKGGYVYCLAWSELSRTL